MEISPIRRSHRSTTFYVQEADSTFLETPCEEVPMKSLRWNFPRCMNRRVRHVTQHEGSEWVYSMGIP